MGGDESERGQWDASPESPESELYGSARTTDERLRLLANERRRHVLRYLDSTADDVAAFDDVVRQIVRWEQMETGDHPADHQTVVATELHHHHLPKLIDAGVIEYDPRTETIRYRGDPVIERLLSLSGDLSGT